MATVSHFEQVILCDTTAEFNTALSELQNYMPVGSAVAILNIAQYPNETPKRLVATYDSQQVVV